VFVRVSCVLDGVQRYMPPFFPFLRANALAK
jgi:hypothetical protein